MTDRSLRPVRAVVRAAVYCRISLARFGDTLKVDDQELLCRKVAAQRGWTVPGGLVFKDNSRSAWQRRRRRPGWDLLLAAVERRELDAIVVYHGDRLIRQPWDLEVLLRLADEQGIRLASPTGERDLDNADDRYILRIEAAQACRESDNTSRRLRSHFERQAERGLVRLGGRGGRAYGFEPDGITHRADDVEVITEVADRVLAHEPIGAICRDLADRGVTTPAGNPWDHGSLKKLMLRPRLAGLVARSGQIVGPAAWDPILDRSVWESVCTVLEGKAGDYAYATNARRHLLSGIALCGTCDQPVAIRHNTRSPHLLAYGCINPACGKKAHRAARYLDPYVQGAVVELLADDRIRDRLATPVTRDLLGELRRLEARKEAVLESAAAAAAESDVDAQTEADLLRVTVRKLNSRIAELRADVARARTPHALDGLWGINYDDFTALPLHRRRAAVTTAMRVTLLPSGRRGPGFDPSTVLLTERV
ncbi:DNA invertase Pin-like site-specific DNA recombinase [Micromonospora sp. Llam0]|uniref:recombinase family protein n=1 Tax=Micromonospora sp. Llam0 TaxID=2485143 RepID=UPI000F465B6A|nr:recombinase family protein [Micromonospora sp. Llam0]ROO51427.1 DNA invertase Pin-like site-specific DNA recombinase [Micromonospora sp. Llam0]